MRQFKSLILLGIFSLALMASPAPARGDDSGPGARESFRAFCAEWMAKLDRRRATNMKNADVRAGGTGVVLEYTAYSPRPLLCEAQATTAPRAVGRLVYQELRMRKAGATHEKALASRPSVVKRTDIMEIFRYDGRRWRY